ncbi:proteophosphoglycan ppg4 [Rhodotorula toruloides]|uniref:Sterol regulatory element-binding protein cleavage-activating protein n=1 Tax=Rhodotorula toruloides TaxID=5286 RepID=A0A511KMK2_RHOTO|nr:proteophosphoglycan ppg4 [Rhodotorula toruloides]
MSSVGIRSRAKRRPSAPSPAAASSSGGRQYIGAPHAKLAAWFGWLGVWISQHQTLSLLATALVICSLLSPAILLTFSPSGSIFNISTSAITRRGRGELMWELDGMKRQGLISTEEEVCWERVKAFYEKTGREGGGRRIRVEQVLIGAGAVGGRGTISKVVLHRTWRVQEELERRLLAGEVDGNRCLRTREGGSSRCAVISPVGWWNSEDELLRDEDVHRTLSSPPRPRSKSQALPLTISQTFVGVGRDRHGLVKSAQQLVVSFLFDDGPIATPFASTSSPQINSTVVEKAARTAASSAWRTAVQEVVDRKDQRSSATGRAADPMGVTTENRMSPRHIVLKYLPHLTVAGHHRRLENLIYGTGYLLVALYVWRYIRKLRAHSKLGLLVTGCVELAASGIMSVSICWLLGWSLGLVPWNLLAFLVLTSGLDNMILVLRSIGSTDVNLPVPQRMSIGLRSVGVEMTVLLAVEELMALLLLWWVQISVMREWIRFGAVVLVVDYFLEITFFSTVLSIDIQRLELADLLAQNPSSGYQAVPSCAQSEKDRTGASASASVGASIKLAWKVLRDRPAKTSTVAFLWAINLLLWAFYGSEHYLPAVCSQTALSSDRPFLAPSLAPDITRSLRLGQTTDPSSSSYLDIPSGAASAFWQLVNPSNATSVQVYLEPTVSIQFFDEDILAAPESIELLFPTDSAPSIVTKVGLVLLPIAVVMGLLYLLLLHLLKDAELLQAHWGSEERLGGPGNRNRRKREAEKRPDAGVEVAKPMSARHVNDVELIASGGNVVASWAALEDCIFVRHRHDASSTLDLPVGAEPPILSSLLVDPSGRFCAAVTATGRLHVWSIENGGPPLDLGETSRISSPVVALAVCGSAIHSVANGTGTFSTNGSAGGKRLESVEPALFFALNRDGSVVTWSPRTGETVVIASSDSQQGAATFTSFVTPTSAGSPPTTPLLAKASQDGRLQLVSFDAGVEDTIYDESVQRTGARVTALAVSRAEGGIVATGYSDGHIVFRSLANPAILLGETQALDGPVRRVSLAPPPERQTCSDCGEGIDDGFVAVVSDRSTLRVLRVYGPPTPAAVKPCKCNTDDLETIARSRSSSMGVGSPAMARTLSNGMSRRFSPRKKPPTPIRLQQQPLPLGDSPIRPRARQYASNGSSSSSGSSSPTRDRSLNGLSILGTPAPPPPMATSPAVSQPSSPRSSTVPLAPDTDTIASLDSISSTMTATMRCVEVARMPLDERGGWEVMDGRVAGFRRARSLGVAGQREWEVWTLELGCAGAAYDEGYEEGTANLADVLQPERDEEEGGTVASQPTTPTSALRHRRPSAVHILHSPRASVSMARPSSIRFAENTVDLPFSRARPVVSALDGKAVSVALGNRVVVLRSVKKQSNGAAQQRGFLGL